MTPALWTLFASLSGAVLFFAGGLAAGMLRARRSAMDAVLSPAAAALAPVTGVLSTRDPVRPPLELVRPTVEVARDVSADLARMEAEIRTRHASTPPPTTRGESLAAILEGFADAGTRSIAIADAQGFPLATTGNDGVALAAYAAVLAESATRAHAFLPVSRPAHIEVVDDRGTRVCVWSFTVESERLLLTSLSASPADAARVEATVAAVTDILAPPPRRLRSVP